MSSNNSNSEMPPMGTSINKQIRIPQPNIYRDDKLHSNQLNFDHPEQFANSKPMAPPPPTQILASPPKYQPPPQPQGGILKNLTNNKKRKTIGSIMDSHAQQQQQQQPQQQLMAKYPSDIRPGKFPELSVSDGQQQQTASSAIPIMARNIIAKTISPKIPQFQRPPPPPMAHPPSNSTLQTKTESQILNSNVTPQNDEYKVQNNFHHMYNPDPLRLMQKPETDIGNIKVNTAGSSDGQSRLPPHAQNKHFQALVAELRATKEANQRLSDDNQELRDLCCFLDDDRQKGRKLAREWQRFGRYTASVMRQEVSAYQNKLRQLDDKQQELIRDNLELKELCLYLDEERSNRSANPVNCRNCGATVRPVRDDGDGSSFGTNEDQLQSELNQQSILSYQTLQYVRFLEQRISQLELETGASNNAQATIENDLSSGRPEAVIRALQILEVREQLENDRSANTPFSLDHMDDGEKALVREMCNVVWKKLEDNPSDPRIDPL